MVGKKFHFLNKNKICIILIDKYTCSSDLPWPFNWRDRIYKECCICWFQKVINIGVFITSGKKYTSAEPSFPYHKMLPLFIHVLCGYSFFTFVDSLYFRIYGSHFSFLIFLIIFPLPFNIFISLLPSSHYWLIIYDEFLQLFFFLFMCSYV